MGGHERRAWQAVEIPVETRLPRGGLFSVLRASEHSETRATVTRLLFGYTSPSQQQPLLLGFESAEEGG